MSYQTDQERFWAGSFGDDYVIRNSSDALVVASIAMFARMLRCASGVESIVELGCNIGANLRALRQLYPKAWLRGYEINAAAAETASASGVAEIEVETIVSPLVCDRTFDLAFTRGVLIHINPEALDQVYDNLNALSTRYVLVFEYYNPQPVEVIYRGHAGKLFKRDFAGDLIDRFGMRLIDYGFAYHRDNVCPQDDGTWFLLEKRQ